MELDLLLMIILASIWTILIIIYQLIYASRPLIGLPYEVTSKVLILTAHAIMLAAIWISVLKIDPYTNWILIAISFMILSVWFYFSKVQDKYMFEQMSKLYEKLLSEAK